MRSTLLVGGGLAASVFFAHVLAQPRPVPDGADWPLYRHDLRGSGYSPLKQIDTTNVGTLTQAWTYRLQPDAPAAAAAAGGGPGRGGAMKSGVTPMRRRPRT